MTAQKISGQKIVYECTQELSDSLLVYRLPTNSNERLSVHWLILPIDSTYESVFTWWNITNQRDPVNYTNRYIKIGDDEYPLLMPTDDLCYRKLSDYLNHARETHYLYFDGYPNIHINHNTGQICVKNKVVSDDE